MRRICSVIAMEFVRVTTWFLEMTDPGRLPAAPEPLEGLEIRQAELPSPEFSRGLYTAVGADWYWIDRFRWTWERWMDWLDRPELETWVAYVRGTPAGFFELERDGDAVELASFGLLPAFIGRGIGTRLLDFALRRAFELEPARVWVHTCSLDGPAALRTYQGRGLEIYDERVEDVLLPESKPEPWPGAERPAA
jgi:GNAT superfamily N-acetyltransferase